MQMVNMGMYTSVPPLARMAPLAGTGLLPEALALSQQLGGGTGVGSSHDAAFPSPRMGSEGGSGGGGTPQEGGLSPPRDLPARTGSGQLLSSGRGSGMLRESPARSPSDRLRGGAAGLGEAEGEPLGSPGSPGDPQGDPQGGALGDLQGEPAHFPEG